MKNVMKNMTVCIRQPGPNAQCGFTYIAVLIFVAILGVGLAVVSEVWEVQVKRDREEELLFAGDQIRSAIAAYARQMPAGGGRYPMRMEDLIKDPRYPATRRYLRKIYRDPVTNSPQWGLVSGPNGELMGVHSTSDEQPMKIAGFTFFNRQFEGATKYSDWVFAFSPFGNLIQPSPVAPGVNPANPNFPGTPGVGVRR